MRQGRANDRLKELNRLVALLAKLSEDELLVFCPSGLLFALPLHALECEGKLFLDRNPVEIQYYRLRAYRFFIVVSLDVRTR